MFLLCGPFTNGVQRVIYVDVHYQRWATILFEVVAIFNLNSNFLIIIVNIIIVGLGGGYLCLVVVILRVGCRFSAMRGV